MRTRALTAAVAATLIAASPAAASHDGGAGGGRDFAVGAGKNIFFDVTPYPVALMVSAHGFDAELPEPVGFLASDLTGHVVGRGELPNGAFQVEGHVTCLKVVGNRATIKYRFKSTSGPGAPPPGWGVQVFVEDNGEPGGGTPDGNATDLPLPPALFEPTADQCDLPHGPFNPVDSGNYVVHDADPPVVAAP